jgi:hypothetical protein
MAADHVHAYDPRMASADVRVRNRPEAITAAAGGLLVAVVAFGGVACAHPAGIAATEAPASRSSSAPPVSAPAAAPASPPRPNAVPAGFALPGCYGPTRPPTERPVELTIVSCMGPAYDLRDMTWAGWNATGADGTGIFDIAVCEPNCAAGHLVPVPVVVHASDPQPPPTNSGCPAQFGYYTDLLIAFPKAGPPPDTVAVNARYEGMPAAHFTPDAPGGGGYGFPVVASC